MIEIKNAISFDEYNAVINKVVDDCFQNDIYTPANYEISLRTALLCAFAPDYTITAEDNNTLWENVTNNEANSILKQITQKQNEIYMSILEAIDKAISYRTRLITSSPMSMSDTALATLFDIITDKLSAIDTSALSKDNIDAIVSAANNIKDEQFTDNLIDTMLKKGLLTNSNRETRRKNIKSNNKNKTDDT